MGGTNETTIAGLRMHVSGSDVHIHDDVRKLKFSKSKRDFNSDFKSAIKGFIKLDGISKISGDKDTVFCLCKDGKNMSAFLLEDKNWNKELLKFVEAL